MEAEAGAHQRALDNLNMALEGFQHEKANELRKAEIACQQRWALERQNKTFYTRGLVSSLQARGKQEGGLKLLLIH